MEKGVLTKKGKPGAYHKGANRSCIKNSRLEAKQKRHLALLLNFSVFNPDIPLKSQMGDKGK
jgi:hypothetical protein